MDCISLYFLAAFRLLNIARTEDDAGMFILFYPPGRFSFGGILLFVK